MIRRRGPTALAEQVAADPVRLLLDRELPWAVVGDVFTEQRFGTGPLRPQGWKLHVSATPWSAPAVLERVLPALLAEGARFKAVNSQCNLLALNRGLMGTTQVGKFITIYPADDAQGVRLAAALDDALGRLPGPRIPGDRQLRPGSLVHYRYGGFATPTMTPRYGAGGPAIGAVFDADGRLTPDLRRQDYVEPEGLPDPFAAAGVSVSPAPETGPLLGRWMVVGRRTSHRGRHFRVLDLGARPPTLRWIKEAWHDADTDRHGRDARAALAHEATILKRYADDPAFPVLYDRFEREGNLALVMELIPGVNVGQALGDRPDADQPLPFPDLISFAQSTGSILAHLHELGLAFGDFKPDNLIRTPAGGYRLIDFGAAYDAASAQEPPFEQYTAPFCSPEQVAGEPPQPADDVYAWGAVLHFLASGQQRLWQIRLQSAEQRRLMALGSVREHAPELPTRVAAVIDRAVAWRRADRYPNMREALRDLTAAARSASTPYVAIQPREVQPSPAEESPDAAIDFLTLARAVGDALCERAESHAAGLCWATRYDLSGLCWTGDRSPSPDQLYSPDLYDGTAGIALFLAELARVTGERRYADAARGAARWLSGPQWEHGRALPGLHAGEAGIGLFYLRLAGLLDEPGYLHAAELRARRLAGVPFQTLDLVHGAAGATYFLSLLGRATNERSHLEQGRAAADLLLREARPAPGGGGGCYWPVPGQNGDRHAYPYLGLLHGAAGIALALAELGAATGDDRYATGARQAADLLLGQGVVEADGSRRWPHLLGSAAAGFQAHCHGAVGIGQAFVRLERHGGDPRYREAVHGAARTAANETARYRTSGLCHGMAGAAAFLLDCYQTTADRWYIGEARAIGHGLRAFARPGAPGVYAIQPDGTVSPDYMAGFAGIGATFLRLARPETLADTLVP